MNDLISARKKDVPDLLEFAAALDTGKAEITLNGRPFEIPSSVGEVLKRALGELCEGHAVMVAGSDNLLTTQQAADMLGFSRPSLIGLIDAGFIPATRTGTHRRIRLDDLLAYKRSRDGKRIAALRKLTAEPEP